MYCKRCKKFLVRENKHNLCRRCYFYLWNKNKRKKWLKEHKCLNCGKKVKQIIIYHTRCDKCRGK